MKYRAETWFERDRAYVGLENENGETILEFWDEEVREAIEDGFLDPKDFKGSIIEYAKHLGVIKQEN